MISMCCSSTDVKEMASVTAFSSLFKHLNLSLCLFLSFNQSFHLCIPVCLNHCRRLLSPLVTVIVDHIHLQRCPISFAKDFNVQLKVYTCIFQYTFGVNLAKTGSRTCPKINPFCTTNVFFLLFFFCIFPHFSLP